MLTQTIPDQWYRDYYAEKRYGMMSLADYIMFRQARGQEYSPNERHEISAAVAA